LKILIAGPVQAASEYNSWIKENLSAEVQIIEESGALLPNLHRGGWDLLIIDSSYRGISIEELVRSVKSTMPKLPIIAICEDAPQAAIEVMRLGVSDYLVKPVKMDRLVASINGVFGSARDGKSSTFGSEAKLLEEPFAAPQPVPDEIVFEGSSKMAAVGQIVDKILDVDLPVLITGESGTGKEIVAQYIYNKSKRKGPFIKINCAAIPSELLESELFGYERGAFTGAYRRKPGKFEAASGGFLFLDEISELPYSLQSKLLHVLQDGTVSTLGSTNEVKVDVRIIVATNKDLEECVQSGSFRDDLFFRLNVVHINVPPLRERLRQLEVLIDYFREKFARQYNTRPVHLDDDAKSFLFSYRWPGNIRELENTIRRATVLGRESLLGNLNGLDRITSGLPAEPGTALENRDVLMQPKTAAVTPRNPLGSENGTVLGGDFSNGLNLKEIAKEAALAAEREAIVRVLQQTRWNRKKTAEILSVSYKTLLTKIKETGLDEN
jgi:DNA-binding NtrC family response regulator